MHFENLKKKAPETNKRIGKTLTQLWTIPFNFFMFFCPFSSKKLCWGTYCLSCVSTSQASAQCFCLGLPLLLAETICFPIPRLTCRIRMTFTSSCREWQSLRRHGSSLCMNRNSWKPSSWRPITWNSLLPHTAGPCTFWATPRRDCVV